MLGRKIKTVPNHVINKFQRDEAVRALKSRINYITGTDDYKTPGKRQPKIREGRAKGDGR